MCRCCQSCLEDIYWSCIGEKFCYDESIANYNPDEDEYFTKKNNGIIVPVQQNDNNNVPICAQPINRNNSTIISSKIHEEDYRREIQTSVPILAPEIMSVFANSQIFVDHPSKIPKNLTKTCLPGLIQSKDKGTDQEKLIKQLEDDLDNPISIPTITATTVSDKKIKFTIASDSSPELERSLSPHSITSIIEEDDFKDEVILRPRADVSDFPSKKPPLRNVQSVPYFSFRPASENDIFSISGSLSRISMTPEVPSISYSTLPKNYEDTPTLEKYKESRSLYSIQTANEARASECDFSMPRYFRQSGLMGQSTLNIPPAKSGEEQPPKRHERSKRLKHLRGNLPPLRIHSIHRKRAEENKLGG